MLLASGIIALLILLTALFVAAEFAAVGARRSRLRRLAEDGNALAARILPVLEDPHALDRYIAASQVGITLCSLILGAYAQSSIAPRVSPLVQQTFGLDPVAALSTSAVLVLLVLTTLAMIAGELIPKSLALQNPTVTALWTVVPMQWAERAFAWSINLLNGSGNLILRLLRVKTTGHRHVHSPEEIELLIAESRDGGLLEPQEQVRLHQALRLGLRTARQLMVPRVRLASIEASAPIPELMRLVATSPYSRLPVYRRTPDDIIGILHTKDVVLQFVSERQVASVLSLLRPIERVNANIPADKLLTYMRERRIHQALVVSEEGRVEGMITLEDVLAELIGGVSDEFKGAPARAILLPDGSVRLPGAMRVEQAAQVLGAPWRGPGDTVGAFITQRLGGVPAPGEHITIDGIAMIVEAVEGDVVSTALVLPPEPPGAVS
ncbi:MAG TPA: hemolysin family protein [Vicinamibacterales bacterium]|nr:hemolysin family protein [Vicinamibacterales bacterium]